jgi:hypothetical protein
MNHRHLSVAALLACTTWLACTAPAHADYFVRPYVQMGAGIIDGYEKNGATERSVNFTSALQSEVSLNQGTIRSYLQNTGPGPSASVSGVMGDRITFDDAAGTQIRFSFHFDGTIDAPARDPNLNSFFQIVVFANLYVFDSSAGATYTNFDVLPGALIGQSRSLQFNDPAAPLVELKVLEELSGSFMVLGGGRHSYDVLYIHNSDARHDHHHLNHQRVACGGAAPGLGDFGLCGIGSHGGRADLALGPARGIARWLECV